MRPSAGFLNARAPDTVLQGPCHFFHDPTIRAAIAAIRWYALLCSATHRYTLIHVAMQWYTLLYIAAAGIVQAAIRCYVLLCIAIAVSCNALLPSAIRRYALLYAVIRCALQLGSCTLLCAPIRCYTLSNVVIRCYLSKRNNSKRGGRQSVDSVSTVRKKKFFLESGMILGSRDSRGLYPKMRHLLTIWLY